MLVHLMNTAGTLCKIIVISYMFEFNIHGFMYRKNILIHTHTHAHAHVRTHARTKDAMLHSLFYLVTAPHVLGGTCTHHQEHKQLYLHHLVFVTPLLLPGAIVMMDGGTT